MTNPATQSSFWRRHGVLKWTLLAVCCAALLLAAALTLVARRAEPFLRARIVEVLGNRFHARVELDRFRIMPGNGLRGQWGLWAEGDGLRIWPAVLAPGAQQPAQPLIQLASFRFHIPLRLRPGTPLHVNSVDLAGLLVHIPPRQHAGGPQAAPAGRTGGRALFRGTPFGRVEIERLQSTGASLVIESNKPGKPPRVFAIASVVLTKLTPEGAMHFQAELTNPRPRGTILTEGSFGPWAADDPGSSPASGAYTFTHADLSTFHGIAGFLDSQGRYVGTLRDMTVDGETDTPDFRLTRFDNAVPLHTRFHAHVDGTSGDTSLEPVEATLGRSHLRVQGSIARIARPAAAAQGPGGHDINLLVITQHARIEDLLRLVSGGSEPLLTGDITFKTSLRIRPGPEAPQQRMEMNGQFDIESAKFTSAKVQDRIRELSLRGLGRPGAVHSGNPEEVQSRMRGNFGVARGVITLPNLDYSVPGADIVLHGAYGLDGGTLDFAGVAKMQATVSQMVGGWKGLLLKPADRLFKKDGVGTEVPVHIAGTRQKPEFGVGRKSKTGKSSQSGEQTHPQSPAAVE